MAWIESHQSLSRHKKTLKAAARLSLDRHTLIGHLMELWWWGIDNVPSNGFMGDVTDEEIAFAADWNGDASQFVEALIVAGFIDDSAEGRVLHDWFDYAGKLLDKREKDALRKREKQEEKKRLSIGITTEICSKSSGNPAERSVEAAGTVPYRTVPNQETRDHDPFADAKGSDGYTVEFETFWAAYPRKLAKREAFKTWKTRVKTVLPNDLIQAATHYAEDCRREKRDMQHVMHASTFLGPNLRYEDYLKSPKVEVAVVVDMAKHRIDALPEEVEWREGLDEVLAQIGPKRPNFRS